MQRLKHLELLGDVKRSVIWQHHPARPDPDPLRRRSDVADHDLRRDAGHHYAAVVLSKPVAVIAETIGQLSRGNRLVQGSGFAAPGCSR